MGVICSALMPHPPIVIEEIGGQELKKAQKTVQGLKKTAAQIAQLKDQIDLIVFITPHGPVFRSAASLIVKENLKGNFADFGQPDLSFKAESDLKLAEKLLQKTEQKNLALEALKSSDLKKYGIQQELDHGILVPLSYLKEAGLDLPLLPLSISFISYQKLYQIGQEIAAAAEELDYNIAVIASGDLSHKLKKGAPAGYDPEAHLFDQKLISYFEEKNFEAIINLDSDLIEKAGECGLRPIITMLGSLDKFDSKELELEVNSYEGPFGVGYGTVFIKNLEVV